MSERKYPESIDIEGSHVINLSRDLVWRSLNDPEILRRCIKGCDEVRKINDTEFEARFRFRIGPIKKSFSAILTVEYAFPPERYRLCSDLDGGAAGSASGSANVALEEIESNCTRLDYAAMIRIRGLIAELGGRMLSKTARHYMDKFFQKLVAEIANIEDGQNRISEN